MKKIKKLFASSPKEDVAAKVDETAVPSSPKVNTTGFAGWKEKMKEEKMKGVTNNFRQRAEQAGVPPERVKDFKYWLRENL